MNLHPPKTAAAKVQAASATEPAAEATAIEIGVASAKTSENEEMTKAAAAEDEEAAKVVAAEIKAASKVIVNEERAKAVATEIEATSAKASEDEETAKAVMMAAETEAALTKASENEEAAKVMAAKLTKDVEAVATTKAADPAASQGSAIDASTPAWIRDAAAYLEDHTLGRDWTTSIRLWTELERSTGYHDKVYLLSYY